MGKVINLSERRNDPRLADMGAPYNYAVGDNYQPRRDTAEIAKLIRRDIKAAVKAGDLPKVKVSVRTSRYSGGSSINVRIRSVEGIQMINADRVRHEWLDAHGRHADACREYGRLPVLLSSEAQSVKDTIERIVCSYNYDRSDLHTDYFDKAFAGIVQFDHEAYDAERDSVWATLDANDGELDAPESNGSAQAEWLDWIDSLD